MSPSLLAALLGLAAAGVSALALVLVHRAAGFTRAHAPVFAAFAGGVVVTLALVHLIPEALAMRPGASWLVLAGFAGGFGLHALVGAATRSSRARGRVSALAPVIAISLHSALDGTVFAVTAAVDAFTAVSTAAGLVVHEFPEALICFVLLQRGGFSDRDATVLAFLAAGATTLLAALGAGPFAPMLDEATLGALFALVAGLLLHVGAAHLLSEAAEAGLLRGLSAVAAGAGLAAVMTLFHSAHHDHAGHDHTHGLADARPDFRPVTLEGDPQ